MPKSHYFYFNIFNIFVTIIALETLNCRHRPKTSTEECFLEHIKVRPYVVAAQTVKLRNVVREQTFRGRPIIVMFFRGKVPSLEQPTPKMLSKAQKKEFRKLDQEENREIGTKTKKTKTLKNPNPLSCLRKKSEKNSCRVVKGVVRSIK